MTATTNTTAYGDLNVYTNDELAEKLNDDFREAVMPVTVFIGIEVFVGFFGNLMVIYVFLFHYHVCNFRYFVLCMAFIDFLSTLTTMPGEIVTQRYWYIYPYRLLCKIKSFFNVFTVTAEALCLLTIALDRYRKVCAPFGWQIRPKTAIILCGIIYAVAFALALPVAFLWGIQKLSHPYENLTVITTICEMDDEYNDTSHPLRYSLTITGITSTCLVLMFILYVFVAMKLIKGKHNVSGKTKPKVTVEATNSSSPPGVSSEVYGGKEYELSSKHEMSDTGYSSGVDYKQNKGKYNYISSDGGLTTDEEEDSSNRQTTLSVPGSNAGSPAARKPGVQRTTTRSHTVKSKGKVGSRLRRKSKIMAILTMTFIITTIMYLTLLSFIAKNVLKDMSGLEKAVYFFFFRLVFINHVVNPMLYGFLDPHFKKAMSQLKHKICAK